MSALPSLTDLIARLKPLNLKEIDQLGAACGVPFETIQNLRLGKVENPKYDTVRRLWGKAGQFERAAKLRKARAELAKKVS